MTWKQISFSSKCIATEMDVDNVWCIIGQKVMMQDDVKLCHSRKENKIKAHQLFTLRKNNYN